LSHPSGATLTIDEKQTLVFRQDLQDLMDFFVSAFPPARHREALRRGVRGRKAEKAPVK